LSSEFFPSEETGDSFPLSTPVGGLPCTRTLLFVGVVDFSFFVIVVDVVIDVSSAAANTAQDSLASFEGFASSMDGVIVFSVIKLYCYCLIFNKNI
jgi:hypothetical protein